MPTAELLLFGPSLLLFSVLASVQDISLKKISNSLVVKILASSLVLNAVYFARSGVSRLPGFLVYLALSFALSFSLWLLDFWKAGDVKFYFAVSSLVHSLGPADFFQPLLIFLGASFAVAVVESVFTRNVRLVPVFSAGLLFPFAVVPLFKVLGGFAWLFSVLLFLAGSRVRLPFRVLLPFALLSAFFWPADFLKIGAVSAVMAFLSWFDFRGTLPSAPLISGSFIYVLVFGSI